MDNNHEVITKSAQETANIGAEIALDIVAGKRPRILCLYGELGSGKTTFTQGFARALGITKRLLSPTFIIVRRYGIPEKESMLYHIDLYRMNSVDDMEELGLSEIFADPAAIVVIEWAERMAELPENRTEIHFEALEDGRHSIKISNA